MPSTDRRCNDAVGDRPHQCVNTLNEWQDEWGFSDPRWDLLWAADAACLRGLGETTPTKSPTLGARKGQKTLKRTRNVSIGEVEKAQRTRPVTKKRKAGDGRRATFQDMILRCNELKPWVIVHRGEREQLHGQPASSN